MSYRIRHKDTSVQAAVRRIARGQVENALRFLDDDAHDSAAIVHDVRKRIKKIRALLRLVRPAFAGYAMETAALRDIAARLGPLRDAVVLIDAFDGFVAAGSNDAVMLAPIRDQLCLRRTTVADEVDPAALLRATRSALAAALPRINRWRLADGGFAAFEGGLESTYRRGRKAMRVACAGGGDDAFHAWRKRCKDHAFHLRLLAPIWPGPMRAQAACAAELGDMLGGHHDLAVLAMRTQGMDALDKDMVAALVSRVHTQQRRLAQRAESLGARLYAEKPSALADSWRRRHAAWKRDRPQPGEV